jgi:hypothetical protein
VNRRFGGRIAPIFRIKNQQSMKETSSRWRRFT